MLTALILTLKQVAHAETSYIMDNLGIFYVYSNGRGANNAAISLNAGSTGGAQGNIIFTNSAGQLCFGMDNNVSNIVLRLDDEDGQPIFTFSEENGTAILDGGDTDVTVHKTSYSKQHLYRWWSYDYRGKHCNSRCR